MTEGGVQVSPLLLDGNGGWVVVVGAGAGGQAAEMPHRVRRHHQRALRVQRQAHPTRAASSSAPPLQLLGAEVANYHHRHSGAEVGAQRRTLQEGLVTGEQRRHGGQQSSGVGNGRECLSKRK